MRKTVIGVMGGGNSSPEESEIAYRMGKLIALEGWVLLNGGRKAGAMDASAKGAKEEGGLTVGILPDKDGKYSSDYIDIQIRTGANDARNYYNVLSSDVVVACKGSAGTISEIALALKQNKHVILLKFELENIFPEYEIDGFIHRVDSPEDAISAIKKILGK